MSLTSGGGNAAATQAQAANENAATQASIQNIQSAYNNPNVQQQYSNYETNLQNYYTQQVNQQQQINARDLMFANARSGLTGGSQAADSNAQLQKDYASGLLSAANSATSATNSLEQANQQQENSLISEAAGGGATGGVGGLISQSQSGNLANAQSAFSPNALNNLFAGTSAIYTNEQNQAAIAKLMSTPYGGLYGGNTGSLYGAPGNVA